MSLIPFLSNSKAWTSGRLPQPWPNNRVSLYEFIIENLDPKTKQLNDSYIKLPDEPEPNENHARWVAGGLEGAFGHHGGIPNDTKLSGQIFSALKRVLRDPSAQSISTFYDLTKDESALEYMDDLISLIAKNSLLHDEKLKKFAKWLAVNAPDRGPVKVGIALIGITSSGEAEDVILSLGQHEEFTLYAVVALGHSTNDPEIKIWTLARTVKGWGKIQAVERLKDTQNEEIKAWLLTDGFRNDVMDEYLAYFCAETGNLLTALNKQPPDESVVVGARDIIRALIAGGPAEDISDYKDGPEVIKRFMEISAHRELGIADYLAATDIQRFVNDPSYDWQKAVGAWNVESRNEISKLAKDILERSDWNQKIETGLKSKDNLVFYSANRAAKNHGIDTWDLHLEKIKADPKRGFWWEVMQSNDCMKIQKVVDLAIELLPLHEIATGASDSTGLGEKYWAHSALDFILQDLGKYPGVGWTLVKVGLQSPVTRNRNFALKALDAWPREAWPDDANKLLSSAEQNEVVDSVRERMTKLIAGQDIDA